jgi:PEP-CTERM motif
VTKLLKLGAAAALATCSLAATAQSSGTAVFDFENGYVDITLTNTTPGTTSIQAMGALYGVTFDIVGGLNVSGSAVSVFGNPTEVTCTPGCVLGGTSDNWEWASVFGYTNYLTALNGAVGENGPDLGILNSGVTSVGASLTNNAHNPLYLGPVTFRVSNTALTANTQISGYQLHFGTNLAAPIPEPSTYALMLAGLGAIGFMARRRRQG